MKKIYYFRDIGLWLFGILAVAALIVSIPATLAVVSWFHVDGTDAGLFMTYAMIGLFELAAVACILAPLWVEDAKTSGIANGLLLLTTGANFLHGLQVFSDQQSLPGAVLFIQQTPLLLWAACALYAGIVPLLLKTFLSKFVKRVQYLRGDAANVQLQVQRIIEPVQQLLSGAAQLAASVQQLQIAEQPALLQLADSRFAEQPVAALQQVYSRVAEQPALLQGVPTTRLEIQQEGLVAPGFEFNADSYRCIKCQTVNSAPSKGATLRRSSGRYGCPECKS